MTTQSITKSEAQSSLNEVLSIVIKAARTAKEYNDGMNEGGEGYVPEMISDDTRASNLAKIEAIEKAGLRVFNDKVYSLSDFETMRVKFNNCVREVGAKSMNDLKKVQEKCGISYNLVSTLKREFGVT